MGSFFESDRTYLQSEIVKKLRTTSRTFKKEFLSDKNFPKPLSKSHNGIKWSGRRLEWYFDKKEGM